MGRADGRLRYRRATPPRGRDPGGQAIAGLKPISSPVSGSLRRLRKGGENVQDCLKGEHTRSRVASSRAAQEMAMFQERRYLDVTLNSIA